MVYEVGGLYFDLDTLPSPKIHEDFLPRLQDPDALTIDRVFGSCEIRVVCAVNPHNADLLRVLKEALRRHAQFRDGGGYAEHGYVVADILVRTGPTLARQVLLEELGRSRAGLGFNHGFAERVAKYTARRVLRHTAFRKEANCTSCRDAVEAVATRSP